MIFADFLTYTQCYEIPRNYAFWATFGLLGATVNRKVYIKQGDICIHCGMYICLVGPPGNGKTTVKRFAEKLFIGACPEYPIGPSQQSREDIVKFMASDECLNNFTNSKGFPEELRIYCFFINEFKNFVSYNPAGMLAFLTDIYDEDRFKAGTIKRGLEDIINPCVNILACENPKWIINNLKNDIISGGLSRRMLFVYEKLRPEPKPRPSVTTDARAALERIKKQLLVIKKLTGEFSWTKDGEAFFDKWYISNRKLTTNDAVMEDFRSTKHIQLLKMCMLIDISRPAPTFTITPDLLEEGLAHLDIVESNMPQLFLAAGRNELAAPTQAILDLLESKGGWLPEKELMWLAGKDMSPHEQFSVFRFLIDSGKLYKKDVLFPGNVQKVMMLTAKKYAELTQQK